MVGSWRRVSRRRARPVTVAREREKQVPPLRGLSGSGRKVLAKEMRLVGRRKDRRGIFRGAQDGRFSSWLAIGPLVVALCVYTG